MVHLGIVLIFVGITGSAFNQEVESTLNVGESMGIGGYRIHYVGFTTHEDANKFAWKAEMAVYKEGSDLGTIFPQRHFYKIQEQPTTEVALYSTPREDLYVVLAQPNEDESAIFKVYLNPLVQWVWIGGLVVVAGTFLILMPDRKPHLKSGARRQRSAARYGQSIGLS